VSRVTTVAVGGPSLAEVRDAAERASTPLLWLVDSSATPLDDALEALLRHAGDPAASLPVDERGAPVEAMVGGYADSDAAAVLDAVSARRAPLRHTWVVSLLVARELVLQHAPPDPGRFGPYAGSEWTARVFAGRPGMLVPESRVRVARVPAASPLHALRMMRAGAWGKGDTLREVHRGTPFGR
jgi:hypothetical protein